MQRISPATRHTALFFLITLPLYYFLVSAYMNLDFWYDEMYTLFNFVCEDLTGIVLDYHAPNNHIFHNILTFIYVKALGIQDIVFLMDRPYLIRVLMLVYSTVTLIYIYRIGIRFFNDVIAAVALAVLATTIPFYNFAVQVRGYGMSTMLLTMVLFYLFSFGKSGSVHDAVLVTLLGALSIYTMPSDLYFLMGVTLFFGASGIRSEIMSWREMLHGPGPHELSAILRSPISKDTKKDLTVVLMMACSVGIAVLLYSPVIGDVVDNPWVRSKGLFKFSTLHHVLPQIYIWFLSKRYLLVAITAGGVIGLWAIHARKESVRFERSYILLISLWILPFVFSFIRGDNPFYRVFINLTPVFSLFIAVSFYYCLRLIKIKKQIAWAGVAVMAVAYFQITFAYAVFQKHAHLKADIENGTQSQDIYHNYYQGPYKPLRRAMQLAELQRLEKAPVYTYYVETSIWMYLLKYGIPYETVKHPSEIREVKKERSLYVLAPHPNHLLKAMSELHPGMTCRRVHDDLSFYNIIGCDDKPSTQRNTP